jgi:anti-sigma B factor antagonist
MEVSTQNFKRVDLVTVSGRVDSSSAPDLDEALKNLTNEGRSNLVLDLSQVDYMSSAGLRSLVSTLRDCKRRGGDVRLATPSARVSDVLSLAGLDSIFQIYTSTTEAVGSF